MNIPPEVLSRIFQPQNYMPDGSSPTASRPINRSGPATPPPIPMPANQNPLAGGYMGQAFRLSGVPTQAPQQAPQIDPRILQYLQALGGGIPQGGQMLPGTINPNILYALQALQGRT